MKSLGGVAVGLFEEFAAEEDGGGGAVSGYFVLRFEYERSLSLLLLANY